MWIKSSLLSLCALFFILTPMKAVHAATEAAAEAESTGLFVTVLAIFSFATLALMMYYSVRDNN
ncbi:hypothetical protein [Alkalicoccobacillus murimartini]|uniref:Membrane-anchored protein n=1 Tax=Alkalicoccobacillus murimartini TaxID=171685 RepID=A0ABT9YDQ2_9BACI|nr:hypothetical protein [Alkalicoccobacillus murimartini]MDQ0205970.1 putative membrane-anchored protein [Alkalicoccobacillus murimartini]